MAQSNFSLVRMVGGRHKYVLAKPKKQKNDQPMIFVHGMAGFAAYLIPKMEYFASLGNWCVAPDIMGHGERNEVDLFGKSVNDYVDDIGHFTDTVVRKETKAPIIYIGHSMGGLIVAKKAEQRDDVAAVVLVTPAPPKGVVLIPGGLVSLTFGDLRRFVGMMLGGERFVPSRTFLESLFVDPIASKHVIDLWEAKKVRNESLLVALQLGLSQVEVDASKVRAPMLVIGARKDKIVHHTVAHRTKEYFDADYHLLENLGHMCPFESGWEETAGVIASWLKAKNIHA